VSEEKEKKIIKSIKVHLDKCHGCRACEVACAAFHSDPKYSIVNPARSRIRVYRNELDNVFLPVRAGAYTKAECAMHLALQGTCSKSLIRACLSAVICVRVILHWKNLCA